MEEGKSASSSALKLCRRLQKRSRKKERQKAGTAKSVRRGFLTLGVEEYAQGKKGEKREPGRMGLKRDSLLPRKRRSR